MTTNLNKMIYSALRHSSHVFLILLKLWSGLTLFSGGPAIAALHIPAGGGEGQVAVKVTFGKKSDPGYSDALKIEQRNNTDEHQGQPRASKGEATRPDHRTAGGVTTRRPARPAGSYTPPAGVNGTHHGVSVEGLRSPDHGDPERLERSSRREIGDAVCAPITRLSGARTPADLHVGQSVFR